MGRQHQPFDDALEDRAERPGMTWGIAALVAAALMSILIATSPSAPRDCASIANNDARLACFDAAAQARPAKGAAIPLH